MDEALPDAPTAEAMKWAREMLRRGRPADAVATYRLVLAREPDHFAARLNLGTALVELGRLDESEEALVLAGRLRPDHHGPFINLGHVYRRRDRPAEAARFFREALARSPSVAVVHQSLGSAYREIGRLDDAIACYRSALELDPGLHRAHSNLVYLLYYHPDFGPEAVLAEHRQWAERHARPLYPAAPLHTNDADPDRRIRVGYVSPDLRNHALGLYIEPVIAGHDREGFEIFCYSDAARPDDVTERIRGHTGAWRETRGTPDEQLAALIRTDRIDVLVDLTLHMAGNRLTTFSRRPAPVQVTYMAYPGTSGMEAVDYKITDAHLDPPGLTEHHHTERLLRLPETYWCYRPPEDCPEVSPLPMATTGGGLLTFGALNAFAKVNPAVVSLWTRVLAATPGSRLLVLIAGGERDNQHAREMFRRAGVADDRLELLERRPRAEFLRYFHRVDVSLDPFPYNGHTTTLDSLWMGVPAVTLEGHSAVGRAGVSILTNLDATEWIARTPDEYVAKAAAFACNPIVLADVRANLRRKMAASPLCDAQRLTHNIERLYREAWREWCQSTGKRGGHSK